jgi:preprotein translocase subunit SecG
MAGVLFLVAALLLAGAAATGASHAMGYQGASRGLDVAVGLVAACWLVLGISMVT